MKKFTCLFLILILFSGILSSCSNDSTNSNSPPSYPTFNFDSVEELFAFFQADSETGEIPAVSKNKSYGNPEKVISEEYTDFVNEMIESPMTYVATQSGEKLSWLNREGGSNITLMPAYGYGGEPELWFDYLVDNQCLKVIIQHLNEETTAFAKNNSCFETLKKLKPDIPSTITKYRRKLKAKKLYEKEISLQDRTVSGLIREDKEDERIRIHFVYDDIFVTIWGVPDILTEQWLQELNFSKQTLEQSNP